MKFSYDAETGLLKSKIKIGTTVVLSSSGTPPTDGFCKNWKALEVLVSARDAGTKVKLKDVKIDGKNVGDFKAPDGELKTGTVPYNFGDDFVIKAKLKIDGTFSSSQEKGKAQFIVRCE